VQKHVDIKVLEFSSKSTYLIKYDWIKLCILIDRPS